jgi:outer membrane receptor for ferrienterochelin and colicins
VYRRVSNPAFFKGKWFCMKMIGLCALAALLCLAVPLAGQESDDESVYRLKDITVTGTRTEKRLKDSPVVTEVITAEEIENSSATTVTEILDDCGLMYTTDPMGDRIQL